MQHISRELILYFLINVVFVIGLSISAIWLFFDEALYVQSYGNQIPVDRILESYQFARRWNWLGYIISPFFILLRIFFTSVFLSIGIFYTELKIGFHKVFKVALLADFVYIIAGLVKLIILIFFKEVNTLQDLQFTPLSVIELLDYESVDPLFIYPLNLLNVFEIMYLLVLAWLLVSMINKTNEDCHINFGKSLKLVTASYGSGLLLWVVFVMFISLNLT